MPGPGERNRLRVIKTVNVYPDDSLSSKSGIPGVACPFRDSPLRSDFYFSTTLLSVNIIMIGVPVPCDIRFISQAVLFVCFPFPSSRQRTGGTAQSSVTAPDVEKQVFDRQEIFLRLELRSFPVRQLTCGNTIIAGACSVYQMRENVP